MNKGKASFGSVSPQLRELVAAVCQQTITPEQEATLHELLLNDEEAQLFYLAHLQIHAQLQWTHRSGRRPAEPAEPGTAPLPPLPRPRALSAALLFLSGTAAVIALAAVLYWANSPAGSPPAASDVVQATKEQVATLVSVKDVQWVAGETLSTGRRLKAGQRIRVRAGIIELLFDNGAHVRLQGPVDLTIASESAIDLAQGTVWVEAPGTAYGFRVLTPGAKLVDLGTRFGVAVAENHTELAVYDGLVECFNVDDKGVPIGRTYVTGGQTAMVTGGRTTLVGAASPTLQKSVPAQPAAVRAYWRFEEAVPAPMDDMVTQVGAIEDAAGKKRGLDFWPGGPGGFAAYRFSDDVPPQHMFAPGYSSGHRSFDHGALTPTGAGVMASNGLFGKPDAVSEGFTVEGFFKTDGDQSERGSMSLIYQGESVYTYIVGLNKVVKGACSLGIFGTVDSKTLSPVVRLADKNFSDGRWHYFVGRFTPSTKTQEGAITLVVVDETGRRFDGREPLPIGFVINYSHRPLLLGRLMYYHPDKQKQHYRGLLDEIRISDRPLPDADLIGVLPSVQ